MHRNLILTHICPTILSARPLLSTTVDCDTVPRDRYVFVTMDVPATPTDVHSDTEHHSVVTELMTHCVTWLEYPAS